MSALAVVDYGAGNLKSVQNALARLGADHAVTADPDAVRRADAVIVPGVGEASSAMAVLSSTGLGEAVREAFARGRKIIGICLGCQLILERSEEGNTACLGLLPGSVRAFPRGLGFKVPHMGWNEVRFTGNHPVLRTIRQGLLYYFVHSFYPEPAASGQVLGTTEYGVTFASCLAAAGLVAFQFHLEKSGPAGLALLASALAWRP